MKTRESRITQVYAHLFCGFAAACAILPFILLVVASFTDNKWASQYGYTFFPQKLGLEAYSYIGAQWSILGQAYLMTIVLTTVGVISSVLINTLYAYGISQKGIPGMKIMSAILIFTMLFNGGLVATYYNYVKIFQIKNTFWALLVPNLMMNAFSVILVRNYITHSIPSSIKEAATIDGAGEFKIFARIIMPLSLPIVATIGLMSGLAYWNDWQNGLYFLTERDGRDLYTIQVILNNITDNIEALRQNASRAAEIGAKVSDLPSTTVRMAIAVIGILPIIVLYPFFQRYFVKGITLGGVKE